MLNNRQHNPELIRNALFARCKLYWGAALGVKLLVFILGIIVVVAPIDGKVIALVGLVLAAMSELLVWQSDKWKGAAHGLHRKLDLENAFGWYISENELLDYLARYPGDTDALIGKSTGSYFASVETPGPKRAIENLRESSWWSMHLAESMFWRSIIVMIGIGLGCLMLLNLSVSNLAQSQGKTTITSTSSTSSESASGVKVQTIKIVTSAILFIFSYGLLKFATGYYGFSAKSKQIKESADRLLQSDKLDQIQVIKLWQDYHLAREASPMMPTWIWKLRQKRLNALWKSYVNDWNRTA
jgi:hypothetical protein